jgi:hemerythrin superfamily protein
MASKAQGSTPKPRTRKPAATPKAGDTAQPEAAAKSGKTSTAAVLGVAAVGVVAGLAANLGRKAAVQAPSAMAGDWFDAIKAEHKATLLLFDAMQKTSDTQKTKRSTLLMQMKHALGKHAFMEEMVVYPALREAGDPEDADKLNHEHGYVKQYLYELTNLDKGSPMFLDKVAAFRKDLEKHIEEEEVEIFPGFHAKLSAEKNKAVTVAANKEAFKLA